MLRSPLGQLLLMGCVLGSAAPSGFAAVRGITIFVAQASECCRRSGTACLAGALGARAAAVVAVAPPRVRKCASAAATGRRRFHVQNWSLREAAPERVWPVEARKRLNRSDVMVIVV